MRVESTAGAVPLHGMRRTWHRQQSDRADGETSRHSAQQLALRPERIRQTSSGDPTEHHGKRQALLYGTMGMTA